MQVIHQGGATTTKPIPASLLRGFTGLRSFTHTTITNSAGATVKEFNTDFCPSNWYAARSRPDAPPTSPYPSTCGYNPFTLGGVYGLQAGWATMTTTSSAWLKNGSYTATTTINPAHRKAFGIPLDQSTATVRFTVVPAPDFPPPGRAKAPAGRALPAPGPRPSNAAVVPAGNRPDLVSLPAWGINAEAGPAAHDYLNFNANVWNAGPSALVVGGFRRPGTDLMDAFQYFYDSAGNQIGTAPTGTLEFDPQDGHEHWHFTDFARYTLLKANKTEAVRSQKEAFCLAPTDPIDLTVKGANWKPFSTGLGSACGGRTALSIQEALDAGWGDTYSQYLPGQSFDITGLPNGTYYIEVQANPDSRLYEMKKTNNTSLRKVNLGGTAGARTVQVPPYQDIDAP